MRRLLPTAATTFFTLAVLSAAPPLVAQSTDTEGPTDAGGGLFDFLRDETADKYGLDPAAPDELLGVVVDADDEGVAGATVYLRPRGNWNDLSVRSTTTDDRGQFSFRRLELGGYHLAAVEGARASRTERRKWLDAEFKPDLAREPIVLVLKPARSLRIRVVNAATSQPIAGAKLNIGYPDLPRDRRTDERGEALIAGLYPGSFDVKATAPGLAKQERGISLRRQREGKMTIELEPGAVLVGVARDPEGNPVGRPRPHLRDPSDPGDFFDYQPGNAEGEFRFEHAPTGMSIKLDFDAKGFTEPRTIVPPLKPGETRRVEVTLQPLPPGGSVAGLIVDENGKPIGGAEVSVPYDDLVAYTDPRGRFRIDGVPQRRDSLIVRAPQRAGRVIEFKLGTADEPGEVEVVLQPGAKLRGRVVNEAGEPIAGANVEWPTYSHGTAGRRIKTAADGTFAFDDLPADTDLSFRANGYSDKNRAKLPLNEDRVIDVVLLPEGFIRGRAVDDATGEPLTRFNVRMTFSPERKAGDPSGGIDTDWDSPGRTYESGEGHFEIDDLVVGQPMIVTVEAKGYRSASIRRVEATRPEDPTRVELRLRPIDLDSLLTIAGKLVDAAGEPVVGAEVRLLASVDGNERPDSPIEWGRIRDEPTVGDRLLQFERATTDPQGGFRFEGIYPDAFIEVAYWGDGVAPGRVRDLHKRPADEQRALTFRTEQPATLTVTLASEAFVDVRGVELRRTGDWKDTRFIRLYDYQADAEGRWAIEGVPPGEYKLLVYRRNYVNEQRRSWRPEAVHSQVLSFTAGEAKRLDLVEAKVEPEQPSE